MVEQVRGRVLSGMQPSGILHLGNWLGALENWVDLQERYDSYFMVADWHALTTLHQTPGEIADLIRHMVVDWLAAGLSPERSVIFVQSTVPEHAELSLLMGMITPLGWLERVPSYKEKLRELAARDIHTFGFLGYPVLQAADIALYGADGVPVGQDQVAHVELTREIVRRFNGIYGPVLVEPEALLTKARVLPGLDGRKMSKSYGNTLTLGEATDSIRSKVATMVTDPKRVRRSDPGEPEVCPVFQLHQLFSSVETVDEVAAACRSAAIGCVECKAKLSSAIDARLDPIRTRRQFWETRPDDVEDILREGGQKARRRAGETMDRVRSAMGLTTGRGNV